MRTHSLPGGAEEALAARWTTHAKTQRGPAPMVSPPDTVAEAYFQQHAPTVSPWLAGSPDESGANTTSERQKEAEVRQKQQQTLNGLQNRVTDANLYGTAYHDPRGQASQLSDALQETEQLFQNALSDLSRETALSPQASSYLSGLDRLRRRTASALQAAEAAIAQKEDLDRARQQSEQAQAQKKQRPSTG